MNRSVIFLENTKFISKSEILKTVSASSYANGTSQFRKGKSNRWACIDTMGEEYVDYESLTPMIKKKIGDLSIIINGSIQSTNANSSNNYDSEMALVLDFAFRSERIWSKYIQFYEDRYFYEYEIVKFAQMHSLIKTLLGFQDSGNDLIKIYCAFKKHQSKNKYYNFKAGSYNYFTTKLQDFRENKIEEILIHGNKNIPKENCKMTKYVKKVIINFYCQRSPILTYNEITKRVNNQILKKGYEEITVSPVKKFLALPDIQNRYKPFRLGNSWAQENLESFLLRSHPAFPNDKWEMDGSVLPYYVLLLGIVTRLWYCIIVDVHSRKIIAWAIGQYESRYLVYETYRIAISKGHLAREIVRDNAKAFDCELITELECEMEELGCLVRPAAPGNSDDKGTVEKMHDILHTKYLKQYPGFIGDKWKTDREEFRLAPVEIKELRKKKNALLPETVIDYFRKAVEDCNSTEF